MHLQIKTLLSTAFALVVAINFAVAKDIPKQLPDPDNTPATDKPVKIYILAGQSNMVGMGDISGGGSRWGKQFLEPVVSVYAGKYSAKADYDKMKPLNTAKLEAFGGVRPTPYPATFEGKRVDGTYVTRGFVQIKDTGVYRFKPGYASSTQNIMEVDGKEVHRHEPGKDPVYTPIKLTAGKKTPFKITYLTSAANGLGWVQRLDIPGTLETIVKNGKFPHLVDGQGKWTVRNDVIYKGVVTAVGKGPLTVGLQGNTIGPELQFGHIMGYYHDEPVVVIKSSQGNRSLGWDFLPPGSERYTFEGRTYAGYKDTPSSWVEGEPKKKVNWYAGKQYDDCFNAVHDVLKNFDKEFPQYKGRGYEIAGFAWWQGHKDGGSAAHASRYEQNLVHFIKTLRKEFKAPKAKFVIATIGFGGWKMEGHQLTVAKAQLAVSGDKGKYPEFKSNVKTVETRDFWRDVSVSPRSQGFHYNRNAETYLLVGDALGRGMVKLLNDKKK